MSAREATRMRTPSAASICAASRFRSASCAAGAKREIEISGRGGQVQDRILREVPEKRAGAVEGQSCRSVRSTNTCAERAKRCRQPFQIVRLALRDHVQIQRHADVAVIMAAALAGCRKALVGTGLAISLLFDTNGRR